MKRLNARVPALLTPVAVSLALFGTLLAGTGGAGCNKASDLDGKTFEATSSTSSTGGTGGTGGATNGVGGAGGAGGATGGAGGTGGSASPCGVCDGACVQGHCCRTGSGFEINAFPGGAEAIWAGFAQLNAAGPLEALFVNQLGEDIRTFSLDPKGPKATMLQSVTTGRGTTTPAIGDVDGDGKVDLVVSISETMKLEALDLIQIFKGKGDGTFEPVPVTLAQPGRPTSAALLDFDGDGDLDIFVKTELCRVIRWGNGAGVFDAPTCIDEGNGYSPVVVVHGGFGKRDAFIALNNSSLYLVSWEGGIKTKSTPLDIGVELAAGSGVVDLDGDGDDDILVYTNATSTHPNTVYTFLRTGEADLAQCDTYPTPPGVDTLQRPMLGDFDGDLVPDLLAIDLHDETKSPNTPEFYRSVNYVFHGIP